MKKTKILAIAPYPGMAEAMMQLAKDRTDIDVTAKVGNLQYGLELVNDTDTEKFDVIISRGGTAEMIRKVTPFPVVPISISVYDVLRAIKMAEGYTDKFAVVGYDSITNCAKLLCDLLKYTIDIVTITEDTDVLAVLSNLKDQGYSMILCDMISCTIANQIGLNAILITSGNESIETAFAEAIKISKLLHHAKKEKELLEKIIAKSTEKTIVYNENREIIFSSLNQEEKKDTALFSLLSKFYHNFEKNKTYRIETKWKGETLTIQSHQLLHTQQPDKPPHILLYLHMRKTPFSQDSESMQSFNKEEFAEKELNTYYSTSNYVGDIRKTLEAYSKTTYPILVQGEVGTGKDKAASLIYKNGPYQTSPYYVIDCNLLNEKQFSALLSHENSPFHDIHVTIYLKHINAFSPEQLSRLFLLLDETGLCKRNRLIFSYLTDTTDTYSICDHIMNHLSALTLVLPPLRERREELPSIAALYLNQLNATLGKQIVGFEEEAMEKLKQFSWPHNLDQFRRVLKELVITSNTSYIQKEEVVAALKKEHFCAATPYPMLEEGLSAINIHQTLEEINYDIIQLLLHEKTMNQEKTAHLLGISRSTLWRILKSHKA